MRSENEMIQYLKNNLDAAFGDYSACMDRGRDYECGAHQARGEVLALLDIAKFLGLTEACDFEKAAGRLVPALNHRPYARGNKTDDGRLTVAPLTHYRYGLTPPEEVAQ